MKIGMFADYFLPHIGGVETSLLHQAHALRQAGHEVFIIAPRMRGAYQIDDQTEKVLRLKTPINFWYGGQNLYLWPRRHDMQRLDQLELDVIHTQTQETVGLLAVKYAKSRRLPLIYTAHTFLTPQTRLLLPFSRTIATIADLRQHLFLGKLRPSFKVTPSDGLVGIPCNTYTDRTMLRLWMHFAATANAIIGPSQRMVDYVHHYVPDVPIYRIANPFASQLEDTTEVKPVHHPIRLVTSYVLRPEKRPFVILEALSQLSDEERGGLKLDIYGGGIELPAVKKMVRRLDLSEQVAVHGSVPTPQLQAAIVESDVLISTSVGFDNQPMMFLEAAHAGNAIMFCDPYLKEATDGGNSLLVEQSPAGFAAGLRELLANPAKITQMKRASKTVAKQFTYDHFVKQYQKVLSQVAGAPKIKG